MTKELEQIEKSTSGDQPPIPRSTANEVLYPIPGGAHVTKEALEILEIGHLALVDKNMVRNPTDAQLDLLDTLVVKGDLTKDRFGRTYRLTEKGRQRVRTGYEQNILAAPVATPQGELTKKSQVDALQPSRASPVYWACSTCGVGLWMDKALAEEHSSQNPSHTIHGLSKEELGTWKEAAKAKAKADHGTKSPFRGESEPWRTHRSGWRVRTRIRIKRSYAFLLMLAATFLVGLLLVPGLNLVYLLVEAFVNAVLLFVLLYGILGIFHPRTGRKVFAVLLILLLIGTSYQNRQMIPQLGLSNLKSMYEYEGSVLSNLTGRVVECLHPDCGTASQFAVATNTSTNGAQETTSQKTSTPLATTITSASTTFVSSIPTTVSTTSTSTRSATTIALSDPSFRNGKATIWYPPDNNTLVNYALDLINQDRQTNGLPPVTLSKVPSGQQHADSMLYFGYFSHWDTQGYKPYMRYSLLGGIGAVAENIGQTNCTDSPPSSTLLTVRVCNLTTIQNGLAASEWGMMNNDLQCCNNGHRNNILNPQHNRVSIGMAYDTQSSRIYFVEDFEDLYLTLSSPVLGSNNIVTIQGSFTKSMSVTQLAVFYDPLPTSMTTSQLDSTFAYGPGNFIGGVFPPCSNSCQYYPGAVSVYASVWQVSPTGINIQFSLSDFKRSYGAGVYTIYLQTGDSTGTAFMTYSIFAQG